MTTLELGRATTLLHLGSLTRYAVAEIQFAAEENLPTEAAIQFDGIDTDGLVALTIVFEESDSLGREAFLRDLVAAHLSDIASRLRVAFFLEAARPEVVSHG